MCKYVFHSKPHLYYRLPGDKPQKTPKRPTFKPSVFQKFSEEKGRKNKQKEKNMITVEAEVCWETPRRLSTEGKQWEPAQMLINQGRFSMNVENIDINVEVLSSKEKQALTSKLAKDIVHQFMAQPHVVCPVEPRQQPPVVHPVQSGNSPQLYIQFNPSNDRYRPHEDHHGQVHCLYRLLYIKFDRPLFSHSHNPQMQTLDMLLVLYVK